MNGLERAIQGMKIIRKDCKKMMNISSCNTNSLQLIIDKVEFLLTSLEYQKIEEDKEKE